MVVNSVGFYGFMDRPFGVSLTITKPFALINGIAFTNAVEVCMVNNNLHNNKRKQII